MTYIKGDHKTGLQISGESRWGWATVPLPHQLYVICMGDWVFTNGSSPMTNFNTSDELWQEVRPGSHDWSDMTGDSPIALTMLNKMAAARHSKPTAVKRRENQMKNKCE